MFKAYNTTNFDEFDKWKTKLKLICEHRGLDLDFDAVEGTFDLKDLYDKGTTPRQAAEAIGREIFGL